MAAMTNTPAASFSMRRFMSHRRTGSEDSDVASADEYETPNDKLSKKQQQRVPSWLPSPRKKEAPAPVMIRRGQSIHMISTPIPPVPADLPHSATSSLCSCEKHEQGSSESRNTASKNKAAKTLGLSDAQPIRSPTAVRNRSASLALPSPSPLAARPRRPARPSRGLLSPSEEMAEFIEEPVPSVPAPEPVLSRVEKKDDSKDNKKPEKRQSMAHRRKTQEWSENVQQLIKETDQAFEAVGTALADTNLDFEMPEPSTSAPAEAPIHKPRPTERSRFSIDTIDEVDQQRLKEVASAGSAGNNSAMVKSKVRRSTNPKRGATRLSKSNGMVSRWNLSENVADILTGQRFKKIEADELLTPARIEALGRAREALRKKSLEPDSPRESSESAESGESMQNSSADLKDKPLPTEPSSSTPSSPELQSVEEEEEVSPDTSESTASDNEDKKVVAEDKSDEGAESLEDDDDDEEDTSEESEEDDEAPDFMIDESGVSLLPTPPPRNPARLRDESASEEASSAPESPSPKAEDEAQLSKKRQSFDAGLHPEENDEFLFLKSTPFSLTKPLFRHGPITLSKADMGKAVITMDDTMDWTAFQMAILGGAGEFYPEENEDEDAKLMDDLDDWFEAFGFESLGGLVIAEAPSARSSSRSTVSSVRSTDNDLPIPVHCENPSSFLWNVPNGTSYDKALQSKFFRRSGGLKQWKAEGGDTMKWYGADGNSPPQSPMMPLVAGSDDGEEGVPMGYNLNHDLGDFLAWETAHMAASGF